METVPVAISELKLLQAATQGVMMPSLVVAAVQSLISHIPNTNLEGAINTLEERVESEPEHTPDQHFANILLLAALLPTSENKAATLTTMATKATQWAIATYDDPNTHHKHTLDQIAEEAREKYKHPSPTFVDLAIEAASAAKVTKLNGDPYPILAELAAQAIAWAAEELDASE